MSEEIKELAKINCFDKKCPEKTAGEEIEILSFNAKFHRGY